MHYKIFPVSPQAHLFQVEIIIPQLQVNGLTLRLPAWIPGSYMIRDFSRHLSQLQASVAGQDIEIRQQDKHTWRVEPTKGELTIRYQIYAFDLSVRGAYLDTERGFFNGSSVFLYAEEYADEPCLLDLSAPVPSVGAATAWQVATSLRAVSIDQNGFGTYRANNYAELIDCPVEMGQILVKQFTACGVTHRLAISGHFRGDLERLTRDCQRICETQIRFFGEPAPFEEYCFLLYVDHDLYGGLEHRSSTALMCDPKCLPAVGNVEISDDYLTLLGLISHEYFHNWNVKRIKPAVFQPYDLNQENYTTLLWAFEGITAYYDELFLVRSGLIDKKQYLTLLSKTVNAYLRNYGRDKQTLEDASFNAWTKFYQPNENSPNANVSYYVKGALAALCLDLYIRDASLNQHSLDDIMLALWQKWQTDQQGLTETEWETFAQQVTGLPLTTLFDQLLRSTEPLPLASLLAKQGVELCLSADDKKDSIAETSSPGNKPDLGVQGANTAEGYVLKHVFNDGAAQKAGLSAGDILLALDQNRIYDLAKQLEYYSVADTVTIHFFRRSQLHALSVTLQTKPQHTCRLSLLDEDAAAWLTETRQR